MPCFNFGCLVVSEQSQREKWHHHPTSADLAEFDVPRTSASTEEYF